MRKKLLILALLGLCFNLYSQKAKVEKVLVKQQHLPTNPFLTHIKTFSSDFQSKYDLIPAHIDNSLEIKGYDKTEIENADIIIRLELLDASYSHKLDKNISKKEKDGKEIEVKKEYIQVNSKIDISCRIEDNRGNIIHEVNYLNYDEITKGHYKTGEMEASMNASAEWEKRGDELIKKSLYNALTKVKKATQRYLDERFSYYTESVTFKIATGKGKKFDYTDLDLALSKFQTAAELYSNNPEGSDFKELLKECLELWHKAIKEYIPKDKKARISDKNIEPLYHNIAIAYYLLGDYNNASEWARKESKLTNKTNLVERIENRKIAIEAQNNLANREEIYQEIFSHMQFIRENPNVGKRYSTGFNGPSNHAAILEFIQPYLSDQNEAVRRQAYYTIAKVREFSRKDNIKIKCANLLLQACNDPEPGNVSYGLRYFSYFKIEDFNQEAIEQIAEFLKEERLMRNRELINLAGLIASDKFISPLKDIENSTTINISTKWKATLALARIGDKASIEKALVKFKSDVVNNRFFMDIVPNMIYTKQKEIYDYLVEILMSDEYMCLTRNPNITKEVACAYNLIPEFAKVIENFPVSANKFRNLNYEEAEKILAEVRSWFVNNKDYTIK